MPESCIRVAVMNDGKPYISPPPDAEGPYKYYLLGGVRPVRVTCDESGAKIYAEATNRMGALKIAAVLAAILKDEDVEDITKDEFVELCRRAVRVAAMNERKPHISPPPDADGPYKYYRLYATPVRVICNERGTSIGAEAPDRMDGGKLKIANVLLGRIGTGVEAEDITKQEFVELCRRAALQGG